MSSISEGRGEEISSVFLHLFSLERRVLSPQVSCWFFQTVVFGLEFSLLTVEEPVDCGCEEGFLLLNFLPSTLRFSFVLKEPFGKSVFF